MRLRSSKIVGHEDGTRTPPDQIIEHYLPPSPFGRKRYPLYTDRFITPTDTRSLPKKMLENEEHKKTLDYIQKEILDPPLNDKHDELVSPYSSRYQTSPISQIGRHILLSRENKRKFNHTPIKVLDAPDLQDDFYLNLVDWGSNDCLAIGLKSTVYLWNANTSRVTELYNLSPDIITSVQWSTVGHLLVVGTHRGYIFLFDCVKQDLLRTWKIHLSRVSSLAWSTNVLSSGGKSCTIYHHDIRSHTPYFRMLTGHTQEICGLKWNTEEMALASGSNDNHLMIWDARQSTRLYRFDQHKAAVKALSWSPHKRGLLVSGGGTIDKTIKYWNTISGKLISSHDTGSQICNLIWSKRTDEVVSSHGYSNQFASKSNQINIWKSDKILGTLSGHSSRVLYMSMSHDGRTLVTGAADETLMFWDLFKNDHGCQKSRCLPFLR